MTVAEAGWPLHMRCLPAGRECAALASIDRHTAQRHNGGAAVVQSSLFARNRATFRGGGLSGSLDAVITVEHSVMAHNAARKHGGGLGGHARD